MTAVIVVTPRGTAGHFHIMGVTSPNMKSRIKGEKIIRIGVATAGILLLALAAFAYQASSIPRSQLLNPDELVKLLQAPAGAKPLVIQVGSHVLYTQAHIPGAEYIGPASSENGLQSLRKRAVPLPRDRFIVIYCGCCPWSHCPNIKPADDALRAMGFTNVKVLYIADNFGVNWVDKGYPTAKGD